MQASSSNKIAGRMMPELENAKRCDFCKHGQLVKREEQMAFRQWADKGYLFCRVVVPVDVCEHCGSRAGIRRPRRSLKKPFGKNTKSCRENNDARS